MVKQKNIEFFIPRRDNSPPFFLLELDYLKQFRNTDLFNTIYHNNKDVFLNFDYNSQYYSTSYYNSEGEYWPK